MLPLPLLHRRPMAAIPSSLAAHRSRDAAVYASRISRLDAAARMVAPLASQPAAQHTATQGLRDTSVEPVQPGQGLAAATEEDDTGMQGPEAIEPMNAEPLDVDAGEGPAGAPPQPAADTSEQPESKAPAASPAGAASVPGSGAVSKTPWKSPAPVFREAAKTPATAAPASGWQAIYAEEASLPAVGEPAGAEAAAGVTPATAPTDSGSGLPLDGEGQLPFYLLDAHEELAQPGVVYLFGKASWVAAVPSISQLHQAPQTHASSDPRNPPT